MCKNLCNFQVKKAMALNCDGAVVFDERFIRIILLVKSSEYTSRMIA